MTTLLKADIFFIISSIGVIVLTVAGTVVLYLVGKAAQEVRLLAQTARDEIETIRNKKFSMVHQAVFMGKILTRIVERMYKR